MSSQDDLEGGSAPSAADQQGETNVVREVRRRIHEAAARGAAHAGPDTERQAHRRRQALVWYPIIAIFTLIGGFSQPWELLIAAAAVAYTIYIYRGGPTLVWFSLKPRRRSRAWFYYAFISAASLVIAFSHPQALIVAAITALYSTYLYRGGRFVIWFW